MIKISFLISCIFPLCAHGIVCAPTQYQVKEHHRSAYTRYDGTFVKATFVSSYCKDYSPSYLFLKDLFQNEKPKNWPFTVEKSKQWTEAEKERLIEALENAPEEL